MGFFPRDEDEDEDQDRPRYRPRRKKRKLPARMRQHCYSCYAVLWVRDDQDPEIIQWRHRLSSACKGPKPEQWEKDRFKLYCGDLPVPTKKGKRNAKR